MTWQAILSVVMRLIGKFRLVKAINKQTEVIKDGFDEIDKVSQDTISHQRKQRIIDRFLEDYGRDRGEALCYLLGAGINDLDNDDEYEEVIKRIEGYNITLFRVRNVKQKIRDGGGWKKYLHFYSDRHIALTHSTSEEYFKSKNK